MTKLRIDENGYHLFDRETGFNILLDEVPIPSSMWHKAPRFVSVAVTNLCDLHCNYCYAPKNRRELPKDSIIAWAEEIDVNGGLGVGFGGGEPTLYPGFFELCRDIKQTSKLAVTVTTHLNRLCEIQLEELCEVTNFVRISMDGVGGTYEKLRQRSFDDFYSKLHFLSKLMPVGINFLVNDETFNDLDAAVYICNQLGVRELVLLPQRETDKVPNISLQLSERLRTWITHYCGTAQLSISESGIPNSVSIADPFKTSCHSYAHIDAAGYLKKNSYDLQGYRIDNNGFMDAYAKIYEVEQ